jgi:hypothetical protein
MTNFVGYVIPLSGGYEQILHNEVPTDTGTSCQWHIQICTGHKKMSKNKLGGSKHRSLLLYDSLEVSGAL